MMAQAVPNPPTNDKKRVKVYELRNQDWFDRGTGFCTAEFIFNEVSRQEEPRVLVSSEDHPDRMLLETRILKEDAFQKQQDTLIVWTEPSTQVDMALSFQEGECCASIWKFVNTIQQQLGTIVPGDDAMSDDMPNDPFNSNSITLPDPSLRTLPEIEAQMRSLHNSKQGRDALTTFVVEEGYIPKLIPLVEIAEDMEDLSSLHRLCNIMKTLILLNENAIIEIVVSDEAILGVVGALEYDPDFPSHKANHRQWLGKEGRYKEVVRFEDETIRHRIHATYRLQYLKDVVLARILDDPTFSMLNGSIFYYQVEIVQHLQTNPTFLNELFGIFTPQETDQERKKEAVMFIQQCCAIAKGLQHQARIQLYDNFVANGLLSVINYSLRHSDVGVRIGATDILVAMIDHDPQMIRQTILSQIAEKKPPLTDSLIDLLLVEADLGVKCHIADAIKVLLDPAGANGPQNGMARANGEIGRRVQPDPQQAEFVKDFYDESAKKLFKPLVDLKDRQDTDFSVQQVSLFIYLVEILCFFVRQHTHHSKYFILSEKLGQRIAQLLKSPEKYLQLAAVKFFRNLIGLQDEFYNQQMRDGKLFEPILDVVMETMPRDNLLNSACLELFDYIFMNNITNIICHLVENYREKLKQISYALVFRSFITRYDDTGGFAPTMENSFLDTEDEAQSQKRPATGRGYTGIKDLDAEEEHYFNTSDDEDESPNKASSGRSSLNGASPLSKPLVDYNSDEENENLDMDESNGGADENTPPNPTKNLDSKPALNPVLSPSPATPPEKLSEKRRREDEDEDEMSKLSQPKRRNSTSSQGSATLIRRKKSFANATHENANTRSKSNKIAISISPAIKTGGETHGGENGGG